ncbi:TauD/TfdA family dioxygenase [Streptomyces abikoensis]|uniref:TauD/TfdA family dioxygenase n=1 Tax=Streptomyces abikoensis TaxID=97398 RepID=A0ABW7T6X3_9ACTN
MQQNWAPKEITPDAVGAEPTADGLRDLLGGRFDVADGLLHEKALVFRGFGVEPASLDPILDLLLPNRLAYVQGNSPRTKVGKNVYTSTEYPAEYPISMHNELSYAHQWPARLVFFCEQAAATGGGTPIVDSAAVLEALDPEVRAAFSGGVRYTQNLHGGRGFGKSWQETFETDSRDEVETYLASTGATWEWNASGGLKLRQVRPSTTRHPVTGAEVWFNQSDQWHVAGLDGDMAQTLAQILPEDDLPQTVSFADGTPIPAEYITHVRDTAWRLAVDVPWRTGDLMVIDNVAVAHGRQSFTGPRRVLVAMSD